MGVSNATADIHADPCRAKPAWIPVTGARQRVKERGQCACRYWLTCTGDSNGYLLIVTNGFYADGAGTVLDTVHNQIEDELVHAFAVPNTGKLAPRFHPDMRIRVRGTHLVDRTVAYASDARDERDTTLGTVMRSEIVRASVPTPVPRHIRECYFYA